MKFYRYDAITGRIQVEGVVPNAAALALQQIAGAVAVEGEANPSTQYVDVSTGSLVSIPAAPTGYHRWDATAHAWADPQALAEAKAVRIAQARALCTDKGLSNITTGPVEVPFETADDRAEVRDLFIAAMTQPGEFPQDFITADGTVRSVTVANALALRAALKNRRAALIAAFQAHRSNINALGTNAAVRAYDITAGWPT